MIILILVYKCQHDLDGNGFEDIILSDGGRIHTYYNMGDDNWQIDVYLTDLTFWINGEC